MIFLVLFFGSAISSAAQELQLKVMTFNIWYGGQQVSFAQAAEVIRAARPDLVAVQEPDGNLRLLAEAAGMSYVDEKRNILSRYPLFDPDVGKQQYPYTRVLVRPGEIVAIANTHLTSTPFGPDMLRDGKTPKEVLETENQIRLAELNPYIEALRDLISREVPIFFAGDFNSPSHQDWNQQSKGPSIEWPVTKALAEAGFRDSFREVYPDALAKPGLTWTPGYPHPYKKHDEINERIDMIWFAGKIEVLDSRIIGEADNPAVDSVVDPYPSDHRAVISTFRVSPATAPAMIAVEPYSIEQGSDFLVRFQTPGFEDWGLSVVPRGGKPETDILVSAKGPTVISTRPSIKFGSSTIPAGAYDAVLIDGKSREIARKSFYVLAKNAVPELLLEKSSYKPGEAIKVSWRNAPGMKNDWIGIYRASDPDLFGGYIAFLYTGATVEGAALIDDQLLSEPLEPGDYEMRLMREDSYVMLATIAFTILRN